MNLRSQVRETNCNWKKWITKLFSELVYIIIDWMISLVLGCVIAGLPVDKNQNFWENFHFFIAIIVCIFVWFMQCCFLKRWIIQKISSKNYRSQEKDIEMANRNDNGYLEMKTPGKAYEEKKERSCDKTVQRACQILRGVPIAAVGYTLGFKILMFEKLDSFDYLVIFVAVVFYILFTLIEYSVRGCWWCVDKCCCEK